MVIDVRLNLLWQWIVWTFTGALWSISQMANHRCSHLSFHS